MTTEELTPADPKRCQAEKPNGHSFMTLGGRPGRERCSAAPTAIVSELKPGKDGQCGEMSMCDACLAVFWKQVPNAADYRMRWLTEPVHHDGKELNQLLSRWTVTATLHLPGWTTVSALGSNRVTEIAYFRDEKEALRYRAELALRTLYPLPEK